MDEIKVRVHSYGAGRPLSLVYIDPTSGKKKAKSSGTFDEREAERLAGELERELRSGRYAPPSKVTWADFRKRFQAEKLDAMPESTQTAYRVALDHLERIIDPDRLAKLTPQVMSRFQADARKGGMKTTTLARHLRHIKAALRWAERQGLLLKAPTIDMPKTGAKMKGRAITLEEYERMLSVAPKVRPQDGAAWVRLLTGLWLSGLRLEEATVLSWDDDAPFSIDLTGEHPRFRIDGTAQKSGKSEVLPLTPDFADWLLATFPEAEQVGPVFKLNGLTTGEPLTHHRVGEIVGKIGKKARVVTDKAAGKYATAHDLRRSFGSRWARKTMPAVLRRLMRHANIATTMGFYVDLDSDELAAELWANHTPASCATGGVGNTSGNIGPDEGQSEEAGNGRKVLVDDTLTTSGQGRG